MIGPATLLKKNSDVFLTNRKMCYICDMHLKWYRQGCSVTGFGILQLSSLQDCFGSVKGWNPNFEVSSIDEVWSIDEKLH